MRPANPRQAATQARALLARTLPGSRAGTVRAHLARAERIGAAIYRRFQVGLCQARVKYCRWYLETQTRDLASSTRYRHWFTVTKWVYALGRQDDWVPTLKGPGNTRVVDSGIRSPADHRNCPSVEGPKLPGRALYLIAMVEVKL